MRGIIDGELTLEKALANLLPKQKEFLRAPERYVAYIGGEGSGKTVALCLAAIMNGHMNPGGMSLIGRATIPALKVTTRKTFLELFPHEWCADWKDTQPTAGGMVVHKNGHEFHFVHLDMDDAAVRSHIRSMNLSHGYLDEGSELSEDAFRVVTGRLRRKGVNRRLLRVCGNPGGQDWQWRTFFDEKRPARLKRITRGILAPSTENYHLPKEYIEDRLCIYPPDWQERFIYGSFADFSDKIYKELSRDLHTWECAGGARYEVFGGHDHPPDNWPVIVGIDIGGGAEGDPWALVFIAVQPETGFLYQYGEVYGTGILVRKIADEYFDRLGNHPLDGAAYDWENKVAGLELNAEGVPCAPANKDWRAGVFKVAQYLHPDPRLTHPFTGKKNSPRYFVCRYCCPNTWRELVAYSWAKDRAGNPTGKPVGKDDHTCDAVRYAIHTFRPEPHQLKPKPIWDNPGLDMLSRMFWRDVTRAQERREERRNRPVFGYRARLF